MHQRRLSGRAVVRSAALTLTSTALVASAVTAAQAGPLGDGGSGALAGPATSSTTSADASGTTVAPTTQSAAVPKATGAESRTVLPGGDDVVAELPATTRKDFGLVGLTWERAFGSFGVTAQVRIRKDGVWGAWETLEVDELGTDPGSVPGTEPLWVGEADGVAARVSTADGRRPSDLSVATIDPGTTPGSTTTTTPATAGTSPGTAQVTPAAFSTAVSDGSPTYTARPSVVTRSAWGAPRAGGCDSPRVASHLAGVVVHHTAGSNTYTRAQGPAIVRAIDAYHVKVRKWCDVGYNFLVDKYGTIYEGRAGGMNLPVRGAHAGNWDVNLYTMGVSMIGNLDLVQPSAAMQASMVKLIGWKLGTNYLPATGRITLDGKRLNIISGHRDVYNAGIRPATSTACPGRYGYAWLTAAGGLRTRVASYISRYVSKIKSKRTSLGSRTTGSVHAGETPTAGGYKTVFTKGAGFYRKDYGTSFLSGAIWSRFNAVGAETGVLGFPVTNIHAYKRVPSVTYATFANGRVLARAGKAYAVYGPIYKRYFALKTVKGALGWPTTSVYATKRGLKARFHGGYIKWYRSSGAITVHYK